VCGSAVLVALVCDELGDGEALLVVVESSRQPHQPGCSHIEDVAVRVAEFEVVGAETVGTAVVVVTVTLTVSLQPNHPGVAQLVVVKVVVMTGVEVALVVVESSRQPHQPGVLHVVVLVRVDVLVVDLEDVVESEPLLSKKSQLKQSTHSSSGSHTGTVGYTLMTLSMTLRILWLPMPTLHP